MRSLLSAAPAMRTLAPPSAAGLARVSPGHATTVPSGAVPDCAGSAYTTPPQATTRLEVPPADLKDCKASTAETEDRWVGIVAQGGAAFGLSLDMPAFGDAATPEQIRAVVRYARSLCGEPGWPPGELNFPRAFVVEKAYPEDEVVITDEARGQECIYEHRPANRSQLAASAPS